MWWRCPTRKPPLPWAVPLVCSWRTGKILWRRVAAAELNKVSLWNIYSCLLCSLLIGIWPYLSNSDSSENKFEKKFQKNFRCQRIFILQTFLMNGNCLYRKVESYGKRPARHHNHGCTFWSQPGPNRGPWTSFSAEGRWPADAGCIPKTALQTHRCFQGPGDARRTYSRVSVWMFSCTFCHISNLKPVNAFFYRTSCTDIVGI